MHLSVVGLKNSRYLKLVVLVIILVAMPLSVPTLAEQPQMTSPDEVAGLANAAWLTGEADRALEIVDQGIRDFPQALFLQKLRGDIFATSRRNPQAVQAYEAVLQKTPEALNLRWAKWSVFVRSGQGDDAITELQGIAKQDAENPLVYYRLAQDLRKLDRLEESVEWYEKAVKLVPDLPGWRLALARARFDVMDGRGARDEVNRVLTMVSPGSPEEAAARSLLSVVYGATKERGRRYQPIFSPEGSAAQYKEWASIRADAWRLYEAGRFQEAEPLLRKVVALKPSDFGATHNLGITLMELGRCEEAIPILEQVLTLTASDEVYADTFFRIGLCRMELNQWSEALVHFEILRDAAVEFDESTKGVPVKGGIRILDKKKLNQWIQKVRPHVSDTPNPEVDDASDRIPEIDPSSPAALSEEELYKKIATERLDSQDPIFTRASLMGRDANYSWFRFVIPSSRVMRDDQPMGAHEFIPIDPNDTFPTTQPQIYLVFGLLSASYDEVPLTTECYLETSRIVREQLPLAQDHVVMAMNEQSGYFALSAPEAGWTPGLYRCGLFAGSEVSAYTHADEVRFRIVEPPIQVKPAG